MPPEISLPSPYGRGGFLLFVRDPLRARNSWINRRICSEDMFRGLEGVGGLQSFHHIVGLVRFGPIEVSTLFETG